jgi:hypothetical protein
MNASERRDVFGGSFPRKARLRLHPLTMRKGIANGRWAGV